MDKRFTPTVIAAAQASEVKWGVPASVSLAQWALESAYGMRVSGKNNPFGIKARVGQPGTSRETTEVIGGVAQRMLQTFADYGSLAEAFDAHGKLLATGSAYTAARAAGPDAKRYAKALTGHYATDPQYGAKLIAIMDANDLYSFDAVTMAPKPVPGPIIQTHVLPEPKKPVATKANGAKAASAAVVVVGAAAAASAPHGHWLVWVGVVAAMLGAAAFAAIHWRK